MAVMVKAQPLTVGPPEFHPFPHLQPALSSEQLRGAHDDILKNVIISRSGC